ncbi:MAG TPA: hypothetical protein VIS99_10695 [Terrimicrobiaceae bacterium]
MHDTSNMDTNQSRRKDEPGPQDHPLKDEEEALKKQDPTSSSQLPQKDELADESTVEDKELGTFDKVYEHGRQMGF